MDSPITSARRDRGWSQARLLYQLRVAGHAAGINLPDDDKLRVTLSGWENGRHRPSKVYLGLLCDALEVSEADLGFAGRSSTPPPAGVGAEAVAYLDSILRLHIQADQIMGSQLLIDVVREQARQAQRWAHDVRGPVREPMLRTVSRFAEFSGWVHQDQGDFAAADEWTRDSVDMAQALGDARLVAYGLMRRSNVATESGRPTDGLHLADAALRQHHPPDPRLTALSLRQKASAHAMLGEVADCRSTVDRGSDAAAAGTTAAEADTAYCTVPYMAMEGGQAMLTAGDSTTAVQLLSTAVDQWPARQDRDRGLCLARLAHAYLDTREPEAACTVAHEAIASLAEARSARTERTLRRLRGRLLPFRNHPDVLELREVLATAV